MATGSIVAYTTTIRDLPIGDRPRERLREHGPGHLGNAELIATLLRTGLAGENVLNMAVRLLSEFQGLPGIARATFGEICSLKGVSSKAAISWQAFELGRRLVPLHPEDRAVIGCPEDVAISRQMRDSGELLDHVVLAGQSRVSLKERGLGF